jgi:RsiW-degrading membrane proteinase PrsW (M82 family)
VARDAPVAVRYAAPMLWLALTVVIAGATALLWARMFLRRDKFSPEPRRLLAALFVAGCLSTIPSALIEALLETSDLVDLAVVAPAVEEGCKLAAVAAICWSSRHFNQLVDGAIYGVSCGFGFAVIENILFGAFGGAAVLGVRVVLGPITHPLFTGIGGLFLARAKFEGQPALAAVGLAAAMLLHAGWNLGPGLLAQTGHAAYVLVLLGVIPVYIWLLRRFLSHLETPDVQRLRDALTLGGVPAGAPPGAGGTSASRRSRR